nr:MAG TPA: hypothetical protein [Caudoviricetes sp.]
MTRGNKCGIIILLNYTFCSLFIPSVVPQQMVFLLYHSFFAKSRKI